MLMIPSEAGAFVSADMEVSMQNYSRIKVYLYHWEQQRFIVVERYPFVLGRTHTDLDLSEDLLISRTHCQIEIGKDLRPDIRDLGGQNGTWINGIRLGRWLTQPLREDDWLQIGEQRFYIAFSQALPSTISLFNLNRFSAKTEAELMGLQEVPTVLKER